MRTLAALIRRCAAVFLLAAMTCTTAIAMTVQPVIVDLKPNGDKMAATISVLNTGRAALPVELTAEVLKFTEDGAAPFGPDPGDLVIFPPQALIQPGQAQAFRIQWVGDPDLKQSKSYFITVAQLPVKLAKGQSAIQVLYNFKVLVNVSSSVGGPMLRIARTAIAQDKTNGSIPVIWVQNTGPSYGYLSRGTLRISQTDATGKSLFKKELSPQDIQQTIGFGVIGPNATRKLQLPLTLPSATGTVKAQFDAGSP